MDLEEEPVFQEKPMADAKIVLSQQEMVLAYGDYYRKSPRVHLDQSKIPDKLRHLIPYAEFWGIADDVTREKLVMAAPAHAIKNLKAVIQTHEDDFDEWLAGPEADDPSPSDEYVAFSAMRMASDFA